MRKERTTVVVLAVAGVVVTTVLAASSAAAAANGWQRMTSPDVPGADDILAAVVATAPDDAWTVGQYAYPGQTPFRAFAEHWDGTSWQLVDTAPVKPADDDSLYAIAASGPDDVWAVGWAGAPNGTTHSLVEHWDGTSWTRSPFPAAEPGNAELDAVSVPSVGDAWAVGDDQPLRANATPLVEHYAGRKWHVMSSPADGIRQLNSVYAVSDDDIWAVGIAGTGYSTHPVLEHYDGHGWTDVNQPVHAGDTMLAALSGTGSDDIWATGQSANKTLVEHWDGTAWSVVPSPNGPMNNVLNSVDAITPTDVWAAGSQGYDEEEGLVEHWNGARWRLESTPHPGLASPLSAIAAVTGGPALAVGSTVQKHQPYRRGTVVLARQP